VDREITLRDYGRVLWRGRYLILAAAVAAAIVGAVLSVASPATYTATSKVYLGQATTLSGVPLSTAATNAATAPEVLTSNELVQRVARELDISTSRVRRDVSMDLPEGPGTQSQPPLATITVKDRSRRVAVDLARAYAEAVLAEVSEDFEGVQGTYRSALARERERVERLEAQIAEYGRELQQAAEGNRVVWQTLIASAQEQLATAQTAATEAALQLAQSAQFAPEISDLPNGATSSGGARNRLQTVLFAAIIGLLVGVTVTFVWRGSPAGRGRTA
jgi:hypothetical protein